MKGPRLKTVTVFLLLWLLIPAAEVSALRLESGGQLKFTVSATEWPGDTLQDQIIPGTWADGSAVLRLTSRTRLSDTATLNVHYLAAAGFGDSTGATAETHDVLGSGSDQGVINWDPGGRLSFLDLTTTLFSRGNRSFVHGLDRLALELMQPWGVVILGRQAVTWGNGLTFNPMDLFNPFAPSDIARDYKQGTDMVNVRMDTFFGGELQVLAVPGRKPETGDLSLDCSSLGLKAHFFTGSVELDIMTASHRSDWVLGAGISGFTGDAAWRTDAVYTRSGGGRDDNFLSVVANIDRSWVLAGKNMYGFLEFHYTGLGSSDPSRAYTDPDIYQRLEAGEIFTTGSAYLACHCSVELHPLFNLSVSTLTNLRDGSGLIQPHAVWSMTASMELTVGSTLAHGGSGDEFGIFPVPGTPFKTGTPSSVFLWLTRFF